MRKLRYLINDVRESTDTEDTNAISDREITRYFNDCIRSIQAIVLKNNPRSAYFQANVIYEAPLQGRFFPLPEDCYAFNAVTFVEVLSEASINDFWYMLEQRSQEDQNNFFGWYTKNKEIYFTGRDDVRVGNSAKVWYFKRLPSWQKSIGTVSGIAGQVVSFSGTYKLNHAEYITVYSSLNEKIGTYQINPDLSVNGQITIIGSTAGIVNGSYILPEKDSVLEIDLPDEVETYLLDYVSKRIYSRSNYREDTNNVSGFSEEAKANITAIFGDVSNAIIQAPITNTDYLEV